MKTKEARITKAALAGVTKAVDMLVPEIRALIASARHRAVTAANLSMVSLYWNIGRVINMEVQKLPGRADYGTQVVERLAVKLNRDYGRGFSAPNLWDMKRFQGVFQILQPVARESALPATTRALAMASDERLLVDFSKHFHLGW